MKQELYFRIALCTENERLLSARQKVLEPWRNRHKKTSATCTIGKKVADDLLHLRTNYPPACSRVEKHEIKHELRSLVPKIGSGNIAVACKPILDEKHTP